MKKITIVLVILFSLHAVAQVGTSFTTGGLNYKITTATTVEVSTNPTTLAGAIVIAETVGYNSANYAVTRIANNAFIGCKLVSEISIPNTVISIGNSAFAGCTGLITVTIPSL